MKSNSISLEDELQTLDKKCKLLLTGEWISLVLSGVGTVVTAMTNQAVFAATPLTFSLFLNILSRAHQDKRIYDRSSQNLIEIQRQYASKLQGLRSEFLGVDFSEGEIDGISRHEDLEELATKVKQLESFLEIQGGDYYSQGGAINQEVSILRNHQLEMAEAIETLTSQVEAGPVEGEASVSFDPHEFQDHLDRLTSAVYELEQKTAALAESGADNVSPQGIMSGEEMNLQDQLEPIQAQMMALEERMNAIATADPAYNPETLQHDMEQLLEPLKGQLSALEARIQEQAAAPMAESPVDHTQLQSLNDNVAALQSRLEGSIAQISTDIGDFQASLQSTHEQIDQVHVRMNSIQETLHESSSTKASESIQKQIEEINTPLRQRLTSIQEQLGEIDVLQAQLNQVKALAQKSSEAFDPEVIQSQVDTAVTPLMSKLTAVEEKLQARPQDFTGQLHQVIEPLQSHMVSLEQRINQLSAEGDRTPLLNKIASLQGQLHTVESRLSAVPTQTVDHSHELKQLTAKVSEMQAHLDTVSQRVSEDMAQIPHVIEEKVDDKAQLLSELQALSFEEEITATKKETRSELDTLLDALNF